MRKIFPCIILLLVSISLSAGATGGIEMWTVEEVGTETFPAIGINATFSPLIIPIGIRGGIEYSWKHEEDVPVIGDVSTSIFFILLGLEYYISPPLSPVSFYIGSGAEIITISGSSSGSITGDYSYSSTKFGFLVYTGVSFDMGLMGFFAETGYGTVFAEDANITHIPIRGGIKVNI